MAVTVDEIVTVNPATEAELHRYPVMSEAEVGAVLDSVRASSPAWRGVPIRHRAELMHAAAGVLRRRVDELAGLITAEMGKALAEARAEVEKCAGCFDHFADHAEEYLADQDAPVGWIPELRGLRAAGHRARDHALELPLLAGDALRRARPDGGQHRRAQARQQHHRLRPGDRVRLPRGRLPGSRSSAPW